MNRHICGTWEQVLALANQAALQSGRRHRVRSVETPSFLSGIMSRCWRVTEIDDMPAALSDKIADELHATRRKIANQTVPASSLPRSHA